MKDQSTADDSIGLEDDVPPNSETSREGPARLWVRLRTQDPSRILYEHVAAEEAPVDALDYRSASPLGPARSSKKREKPSAPTSARHLPILLKADEVAGLLRTSVGAIYSKVERGLLPGVVRDGTRVLFQRDEVLRIVLGKGAAQ